MLEEQSSPDGKVAALLLKVKVIPSSSRNQIAGKLGDRLKIKVAAAPEKGKANQAVAAILANVLGIAERNITICSGHTSPEKSVLITGIEKIAVLAALGITP